MWMGWKIYFWILAIFFLTSYVLMFSNYLTILPTVEQPESVPSIPISLMFDLFDIPVSVIALLGLYGFAYRKRIFSYKVWRIWVVIILVWDLLYNLVLLEGLGIMQGGMEESNLAATILTLIFLIPLYIALYLYGYRSEELWQRQHNETVAAPK